MEGGGGREMKGIEIHQFVNRRVDLFTGSNMRMQTFQSTAFFAHIIKMSKSFKSCTIDCCHIQIKMLLDDEVVCVSIVAVML